MNKLTVIVIVIAVILLLPFLVLLDEKPLNFARVEEALREDGLSVTSVETVIPPKYRATSHTRMRVNAADVDVYLYKDQQTIDRALRDIEKVATKASPAPSSGGALGPMKCEYVRNTLYLLTVRSRNQQVRARILYVFQTL